MPSLMISFQATARVSRYTPAQISKSSLLKTNHGQASLQLPMSRKQRSLIKTASISFFDKGGRYFHNEDLVQQINEILKPIYVKYQEQLKLSGDEQRTGRKHDRIIIEVTVSGIRNLCNNTDVCLSNSHFFTEIYNCLYDIAYKNNISRTIIPVYSD